jgi:hypothetical protein
MSLMMENKGGFPRKKQLIQLFLHKINIPSLTFVQL